MYVHYPLKSRYIELDLIHAVDWFFLKEMAIFGSLNLCIFVLFLACKDVDAINGPIVQYYCAKAVFD